MSDFYAGKRVLVTGGLGFIGSNLALRLVELRAQVTLVDSMLPAYGASLRNVEPVRDRVQINFSDVRDQHSLSYLVRGQDLIFSLAGQISHSESMRDPLTDLEINCRSQLSLLECCREGNRQAKIIYASTRQIYGRPRYLPVDEQHPLSPVDVNGINKLAAEMYYTLYHNVHGIETVSLRLTNTYGPRMDLASSKKGFAGIFLREALAGRKIRLFGTGEQRRDFNHVDDTVSALLLAGENRALHGEAFNLGHPTPHSLLDFVKTLQRFADFEYELVPFPPDAAAIDIGDYYGDFAKFRSATGWTPVVDLESGLRRTVEYYRSIGETGALMLERRRASALLVLLLALLTSSIYLRNIDDYFIGDDFDLIRSFHGKPASYFLKLLVYNESGEIWKSWGIDSAQGQGFLRPLKIWLLKLDLTLWGPTPLGFHLTSTLFFVGCILMVLRILLLLHPDRPLLAFAGAWIVAIHPVYSEVVPFITAREETVAALFGLGAFLAFLRHRLAGRSPLAFHVLYALGLLTKESTIIVVALALGHDLAHGRIVGRSALPTPRLVRFYTPAVLIVVAYFAMRWVAFGNLRGGDAYPTGYASLERFLAFHSLFYRSLYDPTLMALGSLRHMARIVLAGTAVLLALVVPLVLCWKRLAAARRADLLFFGPLWYLAATAILFGTHFAVRRNGLVVIGLVLFATLVIDALLRLLGRERTAPWILGVIVVATLLLLPPALTSSLEIHRASRLVETIHESIEERTAGLPDGSHVLLENVPQWRVFPYYFGWALQSSLVPPFSATGVGERLVLIDLENLRLNRRTLELPERYDRTLTFHPERFISTEDEQRRLLRFVREGMVRPEQVLF